MEKKKQMELWYWQILAQPCNATVNLWAEVLCHISNTKKTFLPDKHLVWNWI